MLKQGLLWFDDHPKRPLAEKLDEAAERYEERFDMRPTLVHLNPAQAEGLKYKRLRIYSDENLRRNYFILGVDEAEPASEGTEQPPAVAAAPARAEVGDEAAPALVSSAGNEPASDGGEDTPRRTRRPRGVASVSSVMQRRARSRHAS